MLARGGTRQRGHRGPTRTRARKTLPRPHDRDRQTRKNVHCPARHVAASLIAIRGCGSLTAAKIVGETAAINRFWHKNAYARHNGTAPPPVWTSNRARHRAQAQRRPLALALTFPPPLNGDGGSRSPQRPQRPSQTSSTGPAQTRRTSYSGSGNGRGLSSGRRLASRLGGDSAGCVSAANTPSSVAARDQSCELILVDCFALDQDLRDPV